MDKINRHELDPKVVDIIEYALKIDLIDTKELIVISANSLGCQRKMIDYISEFNQANRNVPMLYNKDLSNMINNYLAKKW